MDALAAALADRDTWIRHWSVYLHFAVTSEDDKRALVPLLAASHSAWTRSVVLRAREHFEPNDQFLEAALLDHHEAVLCYLAATLLRRRYRDRAFGEA